MEVQGFRLPAPGGAGAMYRIGILTPRGQIPGGGFPVVFFLDGQAVLEHLTDDYLRSLESLPAIVTLGYDTDQRFAGNERSRDYTPPAANGGAVEDPRGRPGGGAAAYLAVIRESILPRVQALAPIDMSRSTIWGHSYGGLFSLFAASEVASPFSAHVVASPSLWWDNATYLARVTAQIDAGYWPPRPLIIHKGELERERASNPSGANAQKLVQMRAALPDDALGQLVAQMQAAEVPITYEVFPRLSHGESFSASLRHLLERQVYATE